MLGIRQILVGFRDGETGRVPLQTAFMLATALKCHVMALHVRRSPLASIPFDQYDDLPVDVINAFLEAAERDEVRLVEACRDTFQTVREQAGVADAEAVRQPMDGATASFVAALGQEDDLLPARARAADMVVLGRGRGQRGDAASMATLHAVLLHGGRPVLVAPQEAPSLIGQRVVVAWNGSAEAARALSGALPILQAARDVLVITAAAHEDEGDLGDAEAFLAAHGVSCQSWVNTDPGEPAEVLLTECDALDADLLVMGAYSHSRLRETILGGFTRRILARAGIPVLMAH